MCSLKKQQPPSERTSLLQQTGRPSSSHACSANSSKHLENSNERRSHIPSILESLTLPTVSSANLFAGPNCTFHPDSDSESDLAGASNQTAQRKLLVVTILALLFFVLELVGGFYANSLALMSDSFHLLSDVAGFVISLTAIYLSSQPATKRHSFGFHRAEVLGALLSIAVIYGMTGMLVYEAIQRFQNPEEIDGKMMCIISAIGIVVNVVLAITLGHDHHGHGNSHGHNHSHNHEHNAEHGHAHGHNHEENINVRAAAVHVIGDLIASIGVFISSLIILFSPENSWVDPLCTLIFAILVLLTTFRIVVDSVQVLMEGTPGHIDPAHVQASLHRIPGVIKVHDLHVWNLTTGKTSLTAHLLVSSVDPTTHQPILPDNYNQILETAQSLLLTNFKVVHPTLQIRLVNLLSDADASEAVGEIENGMAIEEVHH